MVKKVEAKQEFDVVEVVNCEACDKSRKFVVKIFYSFILMLKIHNDTWQKDDKFYQNEIIKEESVPKKGPVSSRVFKDRIETARVNRPMETQDRCIVSP